MKNLKFSKSLDNKLYAANVGDVALAQAADSSDAEHAAEILARYQTLKTRFGEIDNKYSLAYVPVKLDFPPTLGLAHMQFEEKTDQELTDQATEQVLPYYTDKLRRLDESYSKATADLSQKMAGYAAEREQKEAEIEQKYDQKEEEAKIETQNRRMLNSAVFERKICKLNVLCSKETAVIAAKYTKLTQAASNRAAAALAAYQESKNALIAEKNAKIAVAKQKLVEKQAEKRLAVEKYNAQVDEKETKYQASCERARSNANEQEYQRGLEAMKLYVTLGESGVEQQKGVEKFQYAKVFFGSGWTKADALAVVRSDGFMQSHLGTRYSAFIDWIESALS